MIVVSNRICVKKGMGEKMAPMFTKKGALQDFEGFEKVEVLVSVQEDHDEVSVNMYWQSQENFEVWRQSDAFKAAHRRPEAAQKDQSTNDASQSGEPAQSPMISSKLVIAQLASQISKNER